MYGIAGPVGSNLLCAHTCPQGSHRWYSRLVSLDILIKRPGRWQIAQRLVAIFAGVGSLERELDMERLVRMLSRRGPHMVFPLRHRPAPCRG